MKKNLENLSYQDLLNLKLMDLNLTIHDSLIEKRINKLYSDLERKGLEYKPHIWISDEWFTPDDIPGFAVPFYLLHPKLTRLEKKEMLEAEGEKESECIKILRHETGHAISHAYKLYNTSEWNRIFGKYNTNYPLWYIPNPSSKDFVVHLNAWYAQAHPVEDFAETFAVWLNHNIKWERKYAGWKALEKLNYVDNVMKRIKNKKPINCKKQVYEPINKIKLTLKEYYERKKKFYSFEWPESYDLNLKKIFNGNGKLAIDLIRKKRRSIREKISEGLDIPLYTIDQLLLNMMKRSRVLKLKYSGEPEEIEKKLLVTLTAQLSNYIHTGYYKIPL
jgi:hypothetical protein